MPQLFISKNSLEQASQEGQILRYQALIKAEDSSASVQHLYENVNAADQSYQLTNTVKIGREAVYLCFFYA